MERLRESPDDYEILDAAQLIKHAFGLMHSAGPGATLAYLFWEPEDADHHPLFALHRNEIASFKRRTESAGLAFVAMSYPELWTVWENADSAMLREHAARLRLRCGGGLGSYEGYTRIDGRKTDAGMFDLDD